MTREELEAAIRRELTRRDREKAEHDGTYADNGFTDRVLAAADSYATEAAADTLRETDKRLRMPGGARAMAVHYLYPISCASPAHDPLWTGEPPQVTCGKCKRTGAYLDAEPTR